MNLLYCCLLGMFFTVLVVIQAATDAQDPHHPVELLLNGGGDTRLETASIIPLPANYCGIFETLQSPQSITTLVNLTMQATFNAIRPFHYQHYALPTTGQYRLHCDQKSNWINTFSTTWTRNYGAVTNLLAYTVSRKVDGTRQDMVCYFVDAASQKEADCLLNFMKQNPEKFPLLEREDRNFEVGKEPGLKKAGTYCTDFTKIISPDKQTTSHVFLFSGILLFLMTVTVTYYLYTQSKLCWTKKNDLGEEDSDDGDGDDILFGNRQEFVIL